MFLFPYIDNGYPLIYPFLPRNCEKPPTIYSILESIVNYGTDDKTKIKDLAKVGRTKIFDFDYPLSDKISKEEFECMILNHYLTRRIGFDTPTLFKIQLNVKLNEIMPMYNKMFDSIDGWDIFKDGEKTTRYGTDNREINSTSFPASFALLANSLARISELLPLRRLEEITKTRFIKTSTLNIHDKNFQFYQKEFSLNYRINRCDLRRE